MRRWFASLVLALGATACGDDGGSVDVDASPGDAPGGCDDGRPWASAPPMPLGPTQETAAVAVDG
jgi:hypothetical protein